MSYYIPLDVDGSVPVYASRSGYRDPLFTLSLLTPWPYLLVGQKIKAFDLKYRSSRAPILYRSQVMQLKSW